MFELICLAQGKWMQVRNRFKGDNRSQLILTIKDYPAAQTIYRMLLESCSRASNLQGSNQVPRFLDGNCVLPGSWVVSGVDRLLHFMNSWDGLDDVVEDRLTTNLVCRK